MFIISVLQSCDVPVALGMENGNIADGQLSASNMADGSSVAGARYNSLKGRLQTALLASRIIVL